ncbi:DUF5412 domain-containing protein [Clostridium botulinum C]|nr:MULTISPECIES: DUF5412 family protein [Clostridium]EGO88869.1 hypothetical protein CBCST_02651 [Clostridium botulinum C str. Stockholm]ACT33651.1 putative lipoprotein [Clostridium botulinum D str. 1873]AYF55265.1 hypothetical protein DFH04_11020 [Clostridium novyi]KEI06292.1 hypothetical protein Z957_p0065 [Clostridium sp. K25]KEI11787.1 hypothetical protein Z959_13005 [Clostridium novyi B str. ATCC 27606]
MCKTKIRIIIFILTLIIFILSGCGICKNGIVKEINTYDNKYKVIAFIREGGSTTGFSPQVSLIKANKKLSDSDSGNIFRCNKSKYIDIQWKDKNTLIIKYDCPDEDVFEKCNNIKDIDIEYVKVQE